MLQTITFDPNHFTDTFKTSMDSFADKVGKMSKGELLEEGVYQFLNLITFCNLGTVAPMLAGASVAQAAAIAQVSKNLNLICKQEVVLAKQLLRKHKFLGKFKKALTPITTTLVDGVEVTAIALGYRGDFGKSLINFAQKDKAFLRSKFLGKGLPEKLKNFAQRFWDKRKGKKYEVLETGARRVRPLRDVDAELIWAPAQYDKIRSCKVDIGAIAHNTKMPVYKIKRIKHHLFYDNTHKLDKRIGKFDPDPEIAAAWDRLVKGDFVKNDIKLLEHEYFESKFEKLCKTDYRTADFVTRKSKKRGYMDRDWKPEDNQ